MSRSTDAPRDLFQARIWGGHNVDLHFKSIMGKNGFDAAPGVMDLSKAEQEV